MISLTHLQFSRIIYKCILKNMGVKLSYGGFAYGNIKPDINNKDIGCEHFMEASITNLENYCKQLINESMSKRQFSTSLGVVCHFLSDYFCLYHTGKYKYRGVFSHTLYETILHFKFLMLQLCGGLKNIHKELPEEDIINTVMNFTSEYASESPSLSRDIKYALNCSVEICRIIIFCCETDYVNSSIHIVNKEFALSKVNGGSI